MSRGVRIIWPALALVSSFVAVFTLTWSFASDPSPSPTSNVLVLTVTGSEPPDGYGATGQHQVVAGVLDRDGDRLCLTPAFAAQWRPDDGQNWEQAGTVCRAWPPDTPLELRFVRR